MNKDEFKRRFTEGWKLERCVAFDQALEYLLAKERDEWKARADAMETELLSLMEVWPDTSWGPDPYVCRWCGCWLRYSDSSEGRPKEAHDAECFAAKHLGRPKRAEDKR